MTAMLVALTMLIAPTEAADDGPERHEVQAGETLTAIANEYDVEVERLWAANEDEVDDPHLILVGQDLVVPDPDDDLDPDPIPPFRPFQDRTEVLSPPQVVEREPASTITSGSVWDELAQCESNQRWSIDTGNGFYGGLQFEKRSWDWAVEAGGHDVPAWPHHASREQQIAVAETLRDIHPAGWGAWPACSRAVGLR